MPTPSLPPTMMMRMPFVQKKEKCQKKKNHFSNFPFELRCGASYRKMCVTYICMDLGGEQMVRVSLAPGASPSVISLFEHIISGWIQHPVAAFARTIDCTTIISARRLVARHFDETIVQR